MCSFFGCVLNQNLINYNPPRRNAKDIVINSELAVLPEKLCIIWISASRKQVKCLVLNTGVRAVMAFSWGFLCSRNLLIILYIYLILNGSILKKQREKCLSCTSSILYLSELLAFSRPVYNGNIRRKTVKRKPLENSTYFLLGSRLFINTSIAIILLRLSGDIESNPGPVFEIPGCSKRGLKVSHLNVRSLLPKIDLVRLFISKNPFDVFTLSETWLKPSITNAEINIPNYLITRQDRKDKAGGGTAIYVREGLPYRTRNDYAVNLLKHVGMKLYDLVRNQCLFVQPIDHLNFH